MKIKAQKSDLFFNSALEKWNRVHDQRGSEVLSEKERLDAITFDADEFLGFAGYLYDGITADDLAQDFLNRV